jgi:hypothetical protein
MLRYRLVDEELPRMIASRLGTSADVVESVESRAPGFGERVLAGLDSAIPEAMRAGSPLDDFARAYRREVEPLVGAAVAAGDVVIVGRLAGAIVGPRHDVVRVFIHAPLSWRIANVGRSLGCDPRQARAEIMRIDEARRTYARESYAMAWGDPHNYDLLVDSSRFGIDGAATLIAGAVRTAEALV